MSICFLQQHESIAGCNGLDIIMNTAVQYQELQDITAEHILSQKQVN